MAISHSIVLVANMGEVRYCNGSFGSRVDPHCPSDGRFQYNTQVVFNEQGELLAKYHKSHLYYEPQWDRGDGVPVTFTTSFGVRFGLMICYDIMWPEPQQSLHVGCCSGRVKTACGLACGLVCGSVCACECVDREMSQ
jgi:pantetheine hydrolase